VIPGRELFLQKWPTLLEGALKVITVVTGDERSWVANLSSTTSRVAGTFGLNSQSKNTFFHNTSKGCNKTPKILKSCEI
jgi:hypothetical protein